MFDTCVCGCALTGYVYLCDTYVSVCALLNVCVFMNRMFVRVFDLMTVWIRAFACYLRAVGCACLCLYLCVCVTGCVCLCVYLCLCVCVCLSLDMCVFTDTFFFL